MPKCKCPEGYPQERTEPTEVRSEMAKPKHPTPYAVRCSGDSVPEMGSCGVVYLQHDGQHGYVWQMNYQTRLRLNYPDRGWYCPNCGSTATFQDDIYEEALEAASISLIRCRRVTQDASK